MTRTTHTVCSLDLPDSTVEEHPQDEELRLWDGVL